MRRVKIPRYIDNPMQILYWEQDEFLVIATAFIFGITMSSVFLVVTIILAGFYTVKMIRATKFVHMQGYLHHKLFSWGMVQLNRYFKQGLEHKEFK